MRLRDILRDPYEAIPALVASNQNLAPIGAFLIHALAFGLDRSLRRGVTVVALATLLIATLLAAVLIAFLYSGAIHLAARAFGAKPGMLVTMRGVAYATLWPAVVQLIAAVMLVGIRHGRLHELSFLPTTLESIATAAAAFLVMVALRALHDFSWPRAIASYVLGVVALMAMVFGPLLLLR